MAESDSIDDYVKHVLVEGTQSGKPLRIDTNDLPEPYNYCGTCRDSMLNRYGLTSGGNLDLYNSFGGNYNASGMGKIEIRRGFS